MSYTYRAIITIGIALVSTSTLIDAFCPHNNAVTSKLDELASHGTANIENKSFHLIGKDKTSIFYQKKLLENDTQLTGFLKISKLLDRNLPERATAQLIELVPTPNFCTYKISLGENERVIALSTEP